MPRFTPDFIDELKSRLRPSDVIGRHVKLKKQGNEFAGLSPFTKEKTPSFFVNDQKGFFHCFSSGKHGDVISFLQETQNLSFHEAVERLAEDAGMELPRETPGEAERVQKQSGLAEACAAAAQFFEAMLTRAPGREASAYLDRRSVSAAQISAFRIGYAPAANANGDRTALKDYLINKGFAESDLVEAGLVIKPEDGGASYDRFRDRVMFPIIGARDRVIAFGGRALDPNARAKYLNSPETPLFHKSNVLYNLGPARAAAASDKAPVIVCEGYMDVIALWGAGIKRAVAPLGTALTEQQLAMLWRASDVPVLCFDGDRAGLGAAHRAVDRAMPLLKPGKSLSFVFLPDGADPDDMVREGGASAFQKALDAAEPFVEVLWRREKEKQPLDTPEKRAALRADLRRLVKAIEDPDVRNAYAVDLINRLRDEFTPVTVAGAAAPRNRAGFARRRRFQSESERLFHEARPSGLLRRSNRRTTFAREASLVLALIVHPGLVDSAEDDLFKLALEDAGLDLLLGETLGGLTADPDLDRSDLKRHLQQTQAAEILERVLSDETLILQSFLRPEANFEDVERAWRDALRLHVIARNAQAEVSEAAPRSFTDGETQWKAAVMAREELINVDPEAGGDSNDGVSSRDLQETLEDMRKTMKNKRSR